MKITETEIIEVDGTQCMIVKFKGDGVSRQTTQMPSEEWFDLIHTKYQYEKLRQAHYFLMDELHRVKKGAK